MNARDSGQHESERAEDFGDTDEADERAGQRRLFRERRDRKRGMTRSGRRRRAHAGSATNALQVRPPIYLDGARARCLSPRMTSRLIAIAALACALSAPSAGALDIVACGQIVPDGDSGVLQADLDCSAAPGEAAITLGKASTLDMNGHAIVARHIGVDCGYDVGSPTCTVRGHGTAPSGVGDLSRGNYGITGAARRIIVSDVAPSARSAHRRDGGADPPRARAVGVAARAVAGAAEVGRRD